MAGEAAAAAVLKVVVQNLIDLSNNEISRIRGLNEEAQNLIQNLDTIQQFLNDAETQTIPTGAVKSWLKRLENAAFEADNVLAELHYHSLSKTLKKKKEKVLISCFSPFIDYARKRKMAVSIKEINMDLYSVNESATKLGLQTTLAYAHTAPDAGMETDAFSVDPIFIGRDEVVSEIVETLIDRVTNQEHVFSILSIVGMGGLGKTTLTKRVFNHQNMKTQFGSRIWVHVSQVFNPINLFNKILKELTSSQSDQGEITRQEILKKLKEALKDKTYLLVLDDFWNNDVSKWEDFLHSLLGVTNTKGNGIIITTRNTDVASIVKPFHTHELKDLWKEECWSIIKAKTFGKTDVPSDFESVGREIAERCGGLPLAASVVGGVLHDKSVDEWRSIKHEWLSSESDGKNTITKILRLSFNNLSSPSLKKCFAYCSIFPKGDVMVKEELIELWMAEGFLGSNDMGSVGDKFYNVLLHSSLLQNVEAYEDRCVMHDLVHDLASSVLGNANGVSRVRYLIQERHSSWPITKEVAKHLRTLIFQDDQLCNDTIFFSDFKCLHVLTLTGSFVEELPRYSVRKLIHLRNFNITRTKITDLPDWIGELHHLQTLRAGQYLKKLPSTIKYLIKLRHFHVPSNVKLPAEIGKLTSLQTLLADIIVQDTEGYKIEELGSLNNLKGSLRIRCLENVHNKEEAEKANLSKLSKLSELRLQWTSNRAFGESINDEEVLKGLQPHSNLKKLEIDGFNGERFPEWTLKMAVQNEPQGSWIGLNHLVEIKFLDCTECEEIPMLGHLPNLKSLYLRGLSNVKSINSSFYGISNETGFVFRALETLELSDMDRLKEWAEVESGSTSEVKVFPRLQSLKIFNCFQLLKAPTQFSSCLKSLEISYTTDDYLPLLIKYTSQLTSLTNLILNRLNGLEFLPSDLFRSSSNLSYLEISECWKLREIAVHNSNLKELIIKKCPTLARIWFSIGIRLTSLYKLEISECDELMYFPEEMFRYSAPVLKIVELRGLKSLQNLPWVIECLARSSCLTELRIVGVPKFMAIGVKDWHFPKLRELQIDVSMEGSTSVATNATKGILDCILQACRYDLLEELSLTGMEIWECLPESIQYFTSLGLLELNNFGMEELPEWFDKCIAHPKSWFKLKLSKCKRLRRLPSTHAMRCLIEAGRVDITDCPELITC